MSLAIFAIYGGNIKVKDTVELVLSVQVMKLDFEFFYLVNPFQDFQFLSIF